MWSLRARAYLARRILAVSEGIKHNSVRFYGYPPQKVSVVLNGVDAWRFCPTPADACDKFLATVDIPEDAIVVVSTARLAPVKRVDRLIRAFDTLALTYMNLWLLLVGDGPLRQEVANLAKSVKAADRIRLLGHLEDVSQALRASHIYVLPSDSEGLPLGLLEAMACELACVATKVTGPVEVIEDGKNGFLVEPSYAGILTGLEKTLKLCRADRKSMGEKARQTVLESFRAERAVAQALTLLHIDRVGGGSVE